MKNNKMMLKGMLIVIACVTIGSSVFAQFQKQMPLNIQGGVENGTIHLTMSPVDTLIDLLKPFDGDKLKALEVHGSDTLVLTVQSVLPLRMSKSKIYLWAAAQWTLEIADSLSDLETASGSYEKLVNSRSCGGFVMDSVVFTDKQFHVARLKLKNPTGTSLYLGEWIMEGVVTFTKFVISPSPLRLIPNGILQLKMKISDDQNNLYANFLTDPITWSTDNSGIAQVNSSGLITGIALGTTNVSVSCDAKNISGSLEAAVLSDFVSEKVPPMTIKVSLLLQDPTVLTPSGPRKLHQVFGWRSPIVLANRLVELFKEATDSVVNFQIVETIDATRLFTHYYNSILTPTQFYNLLSEPGWGALKAASDSGQLWFDYREMVEFYGYDTRRNNGEIDEVWVFAAPYLSMYESQLMGPNAFWWNSPPINSGTALTKLLSVMGLNYERGVDQAYHSFGHRSESAMIHAYEEAQGRGWDTKSPNPTPWDLFTRIEKDMPGQSHVGNIHYPPNGRSDYDYGNTELVRSYAQNWSRYPALFNENTEVNVSTWEYRSEDYPTGDPLAEGQDHLGYLRWWYNHLPRYTGVTDSILNNWWMYIIDYDSAVALVKQSLITSVGGDFMGNERKDFRLDQNYPNPFNPCTNIIFTLQKPSNVSLVIYDILGREVATLVNKWLQSGTHQVQWDARNMPSGVYFYMLKTDIDVGVKKMILLK